MMPFRMMLKGMMLNTMTAALMLRLAKGLSAQTENSTADHMTLSGSSLGEILMRRRTVLHYLSIHLTITPLGGTYLSVDLSISF